MSTTFPQIEKSRNYELFDVFKLDDRHVILTDKIHIVWETLNFKLIDNSKLTKRNLKFAARWEYNDFDLAKCVDNPTEAIGIILRYGNFTALVIGANTGRTGGFTLITTDGELKYVDDFFFHPEYRNSIEQMGFLETFNG